MIPALADRLRGLAADLRRPGAQQAPATHRVLADRLADLSVAGDMAVFPRRRATDPATAGDLLREVALGIRTWADNDDWRPWSRDEITDLTAWIDRLADMLDQATPAAAVAKGGAS
ncbi:MAG: hypothetical protein HQL40_05950 [Alphaproteobacteria bacterium]|nr:hypothetical protein [Alphaproteobacteria bacterium]